MQVAAAASQNLITPPLNLPKAKIVPAMTPGKKKDWDFGVLRLGLGLGLGRENRLCPISNPTIRFYTSGFHVIHCQPTAHCHFGYFLAFFDEFWPFLNLFFISSSDEDINRPNKKVKNTSNKPGPGNNSSSDKSGNRKSAVPKQPHQVPTPLEAPEDVDLGTSFSLTNLLTKVRNGIGILGFWDWEGKIGCA